jgi:predicted metal-dependent phosphoesterase TrpH
VSFVDLHTHSTASDGTFSPTQLMEAAASAGLSAIALTDHDTANGMREAQLAADRVGIRLIPGIEISAEYPHPGTMHILGHFVDPDAQAFGDLSAKVLAARNERNPKIIKRLNELGCKITLEQVEKVARDAAKAGGGGGPVVIGRPHIARALVDAGCVASMKDAFTTYLHTTGAAYFPKEVLSPREAIDAIHSAGGVATLAHPIQLRTQNTAHTATVVNHLKEAGLDGIEVWHCDHGEKESAFFLELAKKYDLVPTGGSDFHGHNKADVILGRGRNNVRVPAEVLEKLEARWKNSTQRLQHA